MPEGNKLGLIVRADNSGLGNQTWELYRHLKPYRVMLVDISQHNGYQIFPDRYKNPMIIEGFPSPHDIDKFLHGLDAVMTVETPYNYYLFDRAHELGVKSILQFNFEFLDYLQLPNLPTPDLLLAPSTWNMHRVPKDLRMKHIPVPVDRDKLPFGHRREAKKFLHVAGHKTFRDRNGTDIVLEAMKHVQSDIELTVYAQQNTKDWQKDERVTVRQFDMPYYWQLFTEERHDVLLLPRRYGGLSLQLDEALSVGMPVIMPDVPPQNDFLPKPMLIPSKGFEIIHTRTHIECWDIDPKVLARKIDAFANNPVLVQQLSLEADKIAAGRSWEKLKPVYEQEILQLCTEY